MLVGDVIRRTFRHVSKPTSGRILLATYPVHREVNFPLSRRPTDGWMVGRTAADRGRDGANDLEARGSAALVRRISLRLEQREACGADDATCEGRLFDGGETRSNVIIPPVIK